MSAEFSCEMATSESGLLSALWTVLRISEDTQPHDQIRRLLSQLDEADFLPPTAWHDAIEWLNENDLAPNLNSDKRPAICREIEDGLRTQIDEFAGRFFSIPPADRRLQWTEMARRAHTLPSARYRLALLEPAIDIERPALEIGGNPRATKLVNLTMQLFPLDATSRRQRIGCELGIMLDEPHDWEDAAHHLAAVRSELAALVPEFLGTVTQLCDHEREKARRHEARVAARAQDVAWEQDNRWYDLDTPQGRGRYRLIGILIGGPLAVFILLQIIGLVKESGLFKGPDKSERAPLRYRAGDIGRPPPAAKKPDSTRRANTKSPLHSGELPSE